MSIPISNVTANWTSSTTVYNAIKMNALDFSSDPESKVLTLMTNTNPIFTVKKDGAVNFAGGLSQSGQPYSASYVNPGAPLYMASGSDTVPAAYLEPYDYSPTESVYIPPYRIGRTFYDNRYSDWAFYARVEGGAAPFRTHLGREVTINVYNPSDATLPRLSAVYISGSSGPDEFSPDVYLAIADENELHTSVVGVIRNDIPAKTIGYMLMYGVMHRTNMGTFNAGDQLWLSTTTPGALTNVRSSDTFSDIFVGHVAEAGPTGSFVCSPGLISPTQKLSAGILTSPTITNNGNGTITVSTASVNLYSLEDGSSKIYTYVIPSASFSPTTGSNNINYVYINYNDSNPIYTMSSDDSLSNGITIIRVANLNLVYKDGDYELYIVENGQTGHALSNKLQNKSIRLYGFERESGFTLAETGSLGLSMTGGNLWWGAARYTLGDVNSLDGSSEFQFFCHESGSWIKREHQTVVTNSYYDNGTDLTPLDTDYYSVAYVYRLLTGSNFVYVLSNQQYATTVDAQNATIPGDLPSYISELSMLSGRCIIKSGSTSITRIDSAFGSLFSQASVTTHESLLGLQGGTGGEHYHLTLAEYGNTLNGNFVRATGSYITNVAINGTSTLTGSVLGTSSWSTNSISSSYSNSSSYANVSTSASHAINSDNSISASYSAVSDAALSASYSDSSSYSNSSSYANDATSASYANHSSTSTSASYANNATSASYGLSSSYANHSSTSTSASYSGVSTSASYANNASDSITSSYSNNSSTSVTASYSDVSTSASYSLNSSDSINALTASHINPLNQMVELSGSLRLDTTEDPDAGGINTSSSYLFVSSSNNDLCFRQNGDLTKLKWINGQFSSGLLYGGIVTFTGSNFYVSSGAGLLVSYNATTGSEFNPSVKQVTWSDLTQSATYITSSNSTYLSIDQNGDVIQQLSTFTSNQYQTSIPLGFIAHLDKTNITQFVSMVYPTYGTTQAAHDFMFAFKALKISGLGLTPISESLQFSIDAGEMFNFGTFYPTTPNTPSRKTFSANPTASLFKLYATGSAYTASSVTTSIDPTKWDNGSGVLQNVSSSQWSIQRVFMGSSGATAIYYGKAVYESLDTAVDSVLTEPFSEAVSTANSSVFLGYFVVKGDTTDLSSTNNSVINSGLFRNTIGGSGGGTSQAANPPLNSLPDVGIVGTPSNGQALIYNNSLWTNGNPASASYSSIALNSTSSSYSDVALNSTSSSYSNTSLSSTSASYIDAGNIATGTLNNGRLPSQISVTGVTASLLGTSSWANSSISSLNSTTASYINTSQTASYIDAGNITTGTLNNGRLPSQISVTGVTASLLGTSSWANATISSSHANSASYFFGTVGAQTSTTPAMLFTPGVLLDVQQAGAFSYDGHGFFGTIDTVNGRGIVPITQYYMLTSSGGPISSSLTNFFGPTSNIPLDASGIYEIEIRAQFTKQGNGAVTWQFTYNAAPTSMNFDLWTSAVAGISAPPGSAGTSLFSQVIGNTSNPYSFTTTSISNGSTQFACFRMILLAAATTNYIKIQTSCAGASMTPLAGSMWKATRLPYKSVGTFAA